MSQKSVETVLGRLSTDEALRRCFQADRAAVLTRQLLAFSRRQVVQPKLLGLKEVVHRLEPMLERAGLRIVTPTTAHCRHHGSSIQEIAQALSASRRTQSRNI